MALTSILLRENQRLQKCLVSDPAHVVLGDRGEHVGLIQSAVALLDKANISSEEVARMQYGPSTAKAVLEYKKKRGIINYTYQSSADNITGRMTIEALDTELKKRQQSHFHLLFALGVSAPPTPKMVIISEQDQMFKVWADQVVAAHGSQNVAVIPVPRKPTPEVALKAIQSGLSMTSGGPLVLSVGHGKCFPQYSDEGTVDFAPDGTMRICGRNYIDGQDFVNVFYDERPSGGLQPLSQKDKDERDQKTNEKARQRLKNWETYTELCRSFRAQTCYLVLLTCKVGGATGFLKRLAMHFMTPIVAYKDQIMAKQMASRRIRVLLAGDKTAKEGEFTNNAFGEIYIPLSLTQMVMILPISNQEWF